MPGARARACVCVCVEGALRVGGHSLYTPLYSFYPYFEYAVCMRLCVWRQGDWPIAIRWRTIAKCQSCDYKSAKRAVNALAPPTFAYMYVGDQELVRDFAGLVRGYPALANSTRKLKM